MNKIDLRKLAGYEDDFALWSAEQGALLRAGRFDRLDRENLAEEIESLGRSQKHEIDSRLGILLLHLLKWERQPEHRSRSWQSSIQEQRRRIARLIKDSPSLQSYPAEVFEEEYPLAREKASIESGVFLELFPLECPYSIENILDPGFFPGGN
jgi:hypothetical protein